LRLIRKSIYCLGAVIAREYGLPCIVGATNATRFFRTGKLLLLYIFYAKKIIKNICLGDIVRLNGSSGMLEKISEKPLVDLNED